MDLKVFITTSESVCSECGEDTYYGLRNALGGYSLTPLRDANKSLRNMPVGNTAEEWVDPRARKGSTKILSVWQ